MQIHKEISKQRSGKTASNIGGKAMPSQSPTVVQAQLETTAPGDVYEQEADRMADMVMRKIDGANTSEATPSNHCPTPTISCFGGTSMPISSQMEGQLQSMQGGGHAMPEGLRVQMEGSFGHDFSNVRLHTDSAAADMSSSINAKAFTHGNDIYFNQGQFQPNTPAGQHLIAHELTHTVQQGGKVAREEGEALRITNKEHEKDDGYDPMFILFSNDTRVKTDVSEEEINLTKRYCSLLGNHSIKVINPTDEMLNLIHAYNKDLDATKFLFVKNFSKDFEDYLNDNNHEKIEFEKAKGLIDAIGKIRATGGDYFDLHERNLFLNENKELSLFDYGKEADAFDENGVIDYRKIKDESKIEYNIWNELEELLKKHNIIDDSNINYLLERKKFWESRRSIFLKLYEFIKPIQLELKNIGKEYPYFVFDKISDLIPDIVTEIQKVIIDVNNFKSEINILFASIYLLKNAQGDYPIPIKAYWIIRGLTKLTESKIVKLPAKVKMVIEAFNKSSEFGDKIAPIYYKYTNAHKRIKTVGDFYGGADTITGQVAAGIASVPVIGDIGDLMGKLAAKAYLALFE